MPGAEVTKLGGVYALLVTPFDDSGGVDWRAYEEYLDWQLVGGPHALFAVCGSSEMVALTPDERVRLAELAVRHGGSVPVVATGNLQASYGEQIKEMHRIEQTGVSAIVVTTRGLGADQDMLAQYMTQVAGETTLPVLAYEFPGYPNHLMAPATYAKLVAAEAVVGLKDTTCTLEAIAAKIAAAPGSLVIQANAPLLSESVRLGAAGAMTIASTAGVETVRRLWDELATGAEAAAISQAQLSVLDALLGDGFPATAKYLLSLAGLPFTPRTRVTAPLAAARLEALRGWYQTTLQASRPDGLRLP